MNSDGYHFTRVLACIVIAALVIGSSVVAYHIVEVYESTELKRIAAEHPQAFQPPAPPSSAK